MSAGFLGAEDTVEREGRRNVLQRRETFTAAHYRHSGGWPVVLAKLGGAGCSRRSWRKKW